MRKNILLWVGCIAGALDEKEYRDKLDRRRLRARSTMEPTRVYKTEEARELLLRQGLDVDAIAAEADGKFMSAFVRAVKPASSAQPCCGPTCCN